MNRLTAIFSLTAAALTLSACGNGSTSSSVKTGGAVYLDPSAPIEQRVEDALSRLTVEEKVAMLHAQSKFSSPGVPRLGIPEVWCTDGPHGIRPEVLWDDWNQAGWTNDSCTAFPALAGLAATWDRDLSALYGKSIGEEAKYRGKTVLLGPGVNMTRTPLNGRTFEYMGEDPYLAGELVVPYIQGVQSNGVAACVKHFAANNQETDRYSTSSNLDDRTLYEIYLPAFEAAVLKGHAWSIMGSYNLYNGQYNCHNKRLLMDILKGEWGFDGTVISDWGGCRDTDEAIANGLDLEFGTWTNGLSGAASNTYDNYYLASPYLERIRDGRVGTRELDDKVRRILRMIFRTTMNGSTDHGSFVSPEHFAAARKIAAEGTVLLKNDGVLPLSVPEGGKILLVGENAYKKLVVGGGSSNLKTIRETTPLQAFHDAFDGKAEVIWERGYVGDPTTTYDAVDTGQDLSESRSAAKLRADAVTAAKTADAVIYIGGLNKSYFQDNEGTDRRSLGLPYGQDELIEALAEAAPGMVVVNVSGSPVCMPWADKVGAIVQAWYAGSEAGHALTDVLTGAVNPSGKLPFTVPFSIADGPLKTARQYPGVREEGKAYIDEYYDEGIFIGYRWYDTQGIPVQFPFGFGLSYTTFEYSGARISGAPGKNLTVSVDVKNTGSVAGAEVVQLYISDHEASVERPSKELKGFDKVFLRPGETATVSFPVDMRALSFFDAEAHKWVAEKGAYSALVGASSEDIRAEVEFTLD